MANFVKLPITDQVPFKAYQMLGYQTSVLYATDSNAEEIFFNTCINYYIRIFESGQFIINYTCDNTSWFPGKDVFFEKTISIDSTDTSQEKLIDIIIKHLDAKMYVIGRFNERFIPNKNAYRKQDFEHSFFLYGYSRDEKLLYAIGYTDNLQFEFYSISFSDLAQGVLCLDNPMLWFRFRNPSQKLSLNLKQLYDELSDYLHSDYTINNAKGKRNDDIYGIRANHFFQTCAVDNALKFGYLDVRFSRFFFENKEFMLKRISLLYQKGYINDYSDKYSIAVQKSKTLHLLFLKYNITKKMSVLKSIERIIAEINKIDEEILFYVYEELTDIMKKGKKEIFS